MDPLSIASGIVGLLGAAGKSAQGVEKALELRHADEDFAVMNNEVAFEHMDSERICA